MEYKDYYKTLGLEKSATADEIKKSYRKLARKYHPDVSKEANAEDKFKEAKEAYEVLKDPEKRKAYDQLGTGYQNGQGFEPPPGWGSQQEGRQQANPEDFSDFFSQIFGQAAGRGPGRKPGRAYRQRAQPQRGQDLNSSVSISIQDAYDGIKRALSLREQVQNAQGQAEIKTKQLNVKIPAGITEGQQIRLAGQGHPGFNGGANGDLYLKIHITDDKVFSLKNKDVYVTLPIAPWEAALGASIAVPTLGGKVNLKIPANSESGKKMRLKGRGLPGKNIGDQYIVLNIVVPEAKTDEEKQLYEKMREIMDFNPRSEMEN